jgi:membrane protease YdiL (CAAX protease family)
MKAENQTRTMRNLAIFVVAVLALAWLGWWVNARTAGTDAQGIGLLIFITSPVLASFPLRAFAGDGWLDLGLKPAIKGNGTWYAVSILFYPLGITLALLLGLALGSVSLADFSLGLFMPALALALLPNIFKNIFEEFGWRGYLAPKVNTLGFNAWIGHLIVGIVWAIWHIPYYFGMLDTTVLQSYTTQSLASFAAFAMLGIITSSFVYGEIRLLTDSVWPAVLMHAIGNTLSEVLILRAFIRMTSGQEFLFSPGPEGLFIIAYSILTAIGLYLLRMRREK